MKRSFPGACAVGNCARAYRDLRSPASAARAGRSRTCGVPREGSFCQALLVAAPSPSVQSIREKITAATNTIIATTRTGML